MPIRFPSADWCIAYKDAINANEKYKLSGREWTHGVVAMIVKADAALGIDTDTAMWLDLDRGACKECKLVSADEARANAAFVLEATYDRWKAVIRREIDPTKAMMQNKLKLTKGHMPTIVKFVNASKDLVESTARVDTQFID